MARLPVLFVPGLGGSFNLGVLLDWRGPTIKGWGFPPFLDYGKTMLDGFIRAGYTRDRDLFVAFYDWRKAVQDSATTYLIPWIDQARERSGAAQVVLVAHSMGGLVARSYLQSAGYRNDVARLITLGTPHRGAANSYDTWEGGDINWDSTAGTVMQVYVWYLEHIHPFQTNLNMLQTIRSLAPGLRDLLPIDDYLVSQAVPPQPQPERLMHERNLWVGMLGSADGLTTLFNRVSVTTINGQGMTTLQSLVVQAPLPPTTDPAPYPDGKPVSKQTTGEGDGTVLLASAQIADPRARNLPPVSVKHDQLPDQTIAQVLVELGETPPELAAPQPSVPRLLIMTASPVQLTVDLPAPAPGAPNAVLSGESPSKPPRRPGSQKARVYDYGHQGKHLNMAVIPQPDLGSYQVRVRGTATGSFSLVAIVIGVQSSAVLGTSADDSAAQQLTPWPSATVQGQVADQTELQYQVECKSYAAPPLLHFDAQATTRNAVERLSSAMQPAAPAVLGADAAPTIAANLSWAADMPPELRAILEAALVRSDADATNQLAAVLSSTPQTGPVLPALSGVVEQMLAPHDEGLAVALLEQLRQVSKQRDEQGA
jgi:pimeloyl-ACP methyl ester carboxylesterase